MHKLKIDIQSEVGKLNAVLLHTPGAEVENMTPKMAQRALYSDILNLSIAQKEYTQIYGVLSKVTKIYEVGNLLVEVLDRSVEKESLIHQICLAENVTPYYDILMDMSSKELAKVLIEGLPAKIDTLTAFLKDEFYALYPLYNFYFTRDSSVTIGNNVLINKMANKVRTRESLIMNSIFKDSEKFDCNIINANNFQCINNSTYIEGGDLLIVRDDILLIGNGSRTSTHAIDQLITNLCQISPKGEKHVIVQQLPHSPESFIHLDMVFTLLDKDKCMIFEPLILEDNQYQTVHITITNGRVSKIKSVPNILYILKRLGIDLIPITCGGQADEWDQEREQWHSGANFFAFAPGKVMSYARNVNTLNELNKHGFEIIPANDIISNKTNIDNYKSCVISIEGSELPRGGGGARCMTMPLSREKINWE